MNSRPPSWTTSRRCCRTRTGRGFTPVERPLTLRALVAELRQYAQLDGRLAAEADEAVRVLARLATAEPPVPGAHPDTWWGLAPLTSVDRVVPPGGTVYVSPSKVESVQKSPLDWFVQAAGGEAATDFARSLGTLVHAIAQDLPDASGAEYLAELVQRWPALGMKDNWEGKLDFRRAEAMVRKLAQYILVMRSEGRRLAGVEQDFEVSCPSPALCHAGMFPPMKAPGQPSCAARWTGWRSTGEGRLVIVDLKTGKRQPGKAELGRHPQLGAYQAAVLAGGFGAPRASGADAAARRRRAGPAGHHHQEPGYPAPGSAGPGGQLGDGNGERRSRA